MRYTKVPDMNEFGLGQPDRAYAAMHKANLGLLREIRRLLKDAPKQSTN